MVRFPTLERARWATIVQSLAQLGFNAIDIPLVWREHERMRGAFDFAEGPRSLQGMLDAVHNAGLRAIVRLGPVATDDAPGLCIPERVLMDRACRARTRRQNPVWVADPPRAEALPSIASTAYRAEACAWDEAAALQVVQASARGIRVERVVIGDGPHAFLRDDPFEIDHHSDARGDLAAIEPPHDGPAGRGARSRSTGKPGNRSSFAQNAIIRRGCWAGRADVPARSWWPFSGGVAIAPAGTCSGESLPGRDGRAAGALGYAQHLARRSIRHRGVRARISLRRLVWRGVLLSATDWAAHGRRGARCACCRGARRHGADGLRRRALDRGGRFDPW